MTSLINQRILRVIPLLIVLFALSPVRSQSHDGRPIADAGLSRYAGQDPIILDGTSSYDPDNSGTLSYTWRQIDSPSIIIIDANTATPTVSGFVQTDVIQICELELVVTDGELTSMPDTVIVIIVPDFGADTLQLGNPPFDRNKPTLIYFGGGNCVTGSGSWTSPAWVEKANIIYFPTYGPDESFEDLRTYYRYGDRIIAYLSSVAPDYKQPIQTLGYSTGGQPAVDVGIHLNLTYGDARYAVNRVTFADATAYCRDYSESISVFLTSSVEGEQCWVDNYAGNLSSPSSSHPNILHVGALLPHDDVRNWYRASIVGNDMNQFNHGVVAGAYWSVIGPGKNLQLASTPDSQTYKFRWYGDASSGYMDFFNEANHSGRLPEPVTLVEPNYVGDSNGVILACEESENAIGYELLLGTNPYRVMDYDIISDTPTPPNDVVILPFEEGWWTVRIRDQYGSTIYADPKTIGTIAFNPYPADGAIHPYIFVGLGWSAGVFAASHDIYFGENFEDVDAGAQSVFQGNQTTTYLFVGFPGFPYPDGLIPGTTYYWRVDDVEANGTKIHKGNIWSVTITP
ncbi:hypothetical protein ACFL5Z_12865 [Planctomycetota bacterium]